MRMKSVSSLILLMGTLGYLAMLIGVRGPAARLGSEERVAVPQRMLHRDLPRRERISPRAAQTYFATVR